jgi:D-lactate dehydrogenase
MKVAVFSTKGYDRRSLEEVNQRCGHELHFFDMRLTPAIAPIAAGFAGVSVFVNDDVSRKTVAQLAAGGTRMIATRSGGFNHIDLEAAAEHGIKVARVPAYSPNSVSEFTVGLILTLGRQIHRAYNRVREHNFSLEGLEGFEIRDKTIGVFGTGKIGAAVIKNLSGFGPRILAFDKYRNPEVEGLCEYIDVGKEIARQADIITLHVPLTPEAHHLINAETIPYLKDGVFLINTSRGALLDTPAVIQGLKSGKIGYLAIDVYEEEGDLFYEDLSGRIVTDDVFARLLTFPNVLVTGHQAYLTNRALGNIAETTLQNLTQFESTGACDNEITLEKVNR